MKYILYIFIILFAKVSLGQSDSIIPPKLKESSLLEASLLGNYNDLWKNFKHINGPVIEREGKVLERVKLTLFIDENGNPSDVKIVKSSNKENYDKYIVNKFNTKEQWTPAFINSKTIKSQVLVFINEGRITHIQLLSSYEKEVFKPVEKMPEFKGGASEMMNFLSKNIIYPKQAREDGIVGKSTVSFVVDSAGNVVKPKIEQTSGNALLDMEALRVVSIMPKWKPGSQNGKDVSVKITIPVRFDLDNKLADFSKQQNELANKFYNDGVNYFGLNQLNQAKFSFLNALKLNVNDTDSKYNLAATYLKLNQKDSACYFWDLLTHSFNEQDKLEAETLIKKHCSN